MKHYDSAKDYCADYNTVTSDQYYDNCYVNAGETCDND